MKKELFIYFLLLALLPTAGFSLDRETGVVPVAEPLELSELFVQPEGLGWGNDGDNLALYSRLSTVHKFLGYSAVLAGISAGIFNPAVVNKSTHTTLGAGAAALSAATMGMGFVVYSGVFSPDDGVDSNMVHAILGITGGTMMVITPLLGGTAHKVVGITGTAVMGLSFAAKWVY